MTVFDTCEPEADVLTGELGEEKFAAHLRDVMGGSADRVYRDPSIFFERTYPTTGLKQLLEEALGRLSGARPLNPPVIRLETSFGGGKTHNLIALYHAARNGRTFAPLLTLFVGSLDILPDPPATKVAGVVGSDLDPHNGISHDGITTLTPWGEIACQLGGPRGYRLLEESDRARVARGVQVFERLIGDAPALIVLDEFAAYLRKASAVAVAGSTLAEQAKAFLMSLLSFVAKMQRVVLVGIRYFRPTGVLECLTRG